MTLLQAPTCNAAMFMFVWCAQHLEGVQLVTVAHRFPQRQLTWGSAVGTTARSTNHAQQHQL
jgi:hypothetical protein